MRLLTIGLVLLALLALPPLLAQDHKTTVEGTVFDSSDHVLVGADVFLRDTSSGLEIHQVTDSRGLFRFLVELGSYQLTAALSGFESLTQDLTLTGAERSGLRLELSPAVLATQVVVVSGSREQELIENSTTKVDVISRRLLRDSGSETVREVLSEEPGIITRGGSLASRSETRIQGIDSRQSLILIDGLPVVGARGVKRGILNMDRQSVGRLDRVEIVKGASSALYGSDAIGGVINMVTRKPRHPFEASLTTSGGSLNRFDVRGDVGFVHEKWSGFFSAERHKQNPYHLIPSSPITTGPGFHRYDTLGKIAYELSDRIKIRATANAFVNQDQGTFFGELGPTRTLTDDSAQNYSASMDVDLTTMTRWTLRGYYGKYDESSILDPLGRPGAVLPANLNQRFYRVDSSVSRVVGRRQFLQGGVEWTQDEYRGFNRVLGDNTGQEIRMVDLWINDRISLHDRLTLTLGGRFNHHSLYGNHFVPHAGALFRASRNFRIRGTFGRGFRAPDLGQLYSRFLNPTNIYQVIGNTNLRPEESTTYQIGFDYGVGKVRWATNFFRNDIKDLIQAQLIGRPSTPQELRALLQAFDIGSVFNPGLHRLFFHYRNVEDVYTSGIESKLELRLTNGLMISTGYTYLDARDKATDAFLSERHRHHGNFRIFYHSSRMGGWRTNLRGTYFGKWPSSGARDTPTYGSQKILFGDAYQIWDWYVAKPVSQGAEIFFAMDNLFDSKDPNLNATQPSFLRVDPGRLFRVGMRWTFKRE